MTTCKLFNQSCTIHELIDVLISSIEAKDDYTRGHSDRVADLSEAIAKKMLLSQDQVFEIHIAGHMHDLGKIHIPDSILSKEGQLTDHEWQVVKKHPQVGAHILSKLRNFDRIEKMVLHHHERFDGGGYPAGIKGSDIPLGARIIAVSDSIDAMLTKRPYRPALSVETCIEELKNNRWSQFDPQVADLAIDLLRQESFEGVFMKYQEATSGVG